MIKSYLIDWEYKEHWDTFYNAMEAFKIAKKLFRHFKIKNGKVNFKNRKNGYACYLLNIISLPKKDITLGMICHEIGHLLAYKYGEKGHNKKAYKHIKKIYKYAIKYISTEKLLNIKYNQRMLEYKTKENI